MSQLDREETAHSAQGSQENKTPDVPDESQTAVASAAAVQPINTSIEPIAERHSPTTLAQTLARSKLGADQFSEPLDSDGAFVRRTYAHFEATGVPDDGFTEGKEYTRQRHGLSAWEEAALSPPSTTVSVFKDSARQSPSIGSPPQTAPQVSIAPNSSSSGRAYNSGIENSPNTALSPSGRAGTPKLESTASALSALNQPGDNRSQSAFATSASSESALSANTFLSGNEWQRRQDVAEKKRQELISKVDRYGFFADSSFNSYHRSALLSASLFEAPLPKKGGSDIANPSVTKPKSLVSDVHDANGRHERTATSATDHIPSTIAEGRAGFDEVHRKKEKVRIAKWTRMLCVASRDQGHNAATYTFASGLSAKRLRRRVYKGIPDIWRSAAWMALLRQQKALDASQSMLRSDLEPASVQNFADLKETPSPHDVQIDLDVPRTISGHVQFHTRYGQGQRDLFHVLHDISLLCSDCGYCQGMGPIAATFLCYFPPEHVYLVMVMAHNHMGLHDTFRPGFPGLVENLYVQDQLVKTYMPEMHMAFKDQMVSTSAYATKWYITLFSNSIPFETQLRMWDAWLLEGQDVITLFALAILWSFRATILDSQADFEVILGCLSGYFVPENDDSILRWVSKALKRKDVKKSIVDARTEYRHKLANDEPIDML